LPLSEIIVPYDDEGFYGGSIIILFVIYVLIPLAIIVLIGAGVAYLLFPKIINEFKLLIGLYYDAEWREALSRHFIHFLLFVLFAFAFLFLIYKLFDPSYFYLLMLLVFLYSSLRSSFNFMSIFVDRISISDSPSSISLTWYFNASGFIASPRCNRNLS